MLSTLASFLVSPKGELRLSLLATIKIFKSTPVKCIFAGRYMVVEMLSLLLVRVLTIISVHCLVCILANVNGNYF